MSLESGNELTMSLSPFNHSPSELNLNSFNALWRRHCKAMRAQHASITDALSGRRLDTLAHCVPIVRTASDATKDAAKGGRQAAQAAAPSEEQQEDA